VGLVVWERDDMFTKGAQCGILLCIQIGVGIYGPTAFRDSCGPCGICSSSILLA
jgi:hypothetical protein